MRIKVNSPKHVVHTFKSKPVSDLGKFTRIDQRPMTSRSDTESMLVRNDYNNTFYLRRFFHITPECFRDHLNDVARLCETPHPSVLRLIGRLKDGDSYAIQYEHFSENLHDFITRRLKKGMYLTAAEALWVTRQLVAALAVWFTPGRTHGTICLQNILIARNGQNQLVFKIGKVRDQDLVPQVISGQTLQDKQRIDMFDIGIAIYQILTMNPNVDIIAPERFVPAQTDDKSPQQSKQKDPMPLLSEIRTQLENKDSDVRRRYTQVSPILDSLLQMLDPNPTQRPVPKNVQITLAAINLRDFENTISDHDDCIVPAGSGDSIVKTAQQGQEESQYQLSLLLRERGHSAQCVAWAQKAAEQDHLGACVLVGNALLIGEGCTRDPAKAELWFQKAIEIEGSQLQFRQKAEQQLAALLFDKGDFKKVADFKRNGKSLRAETLADLGLMLLLGKRFSGKHGLTKNEKTAKAYLTQAADQGCTIAQYYAGLLQKAAEHVDLHLCESDGRSVLAGTFATLPIEDKNKPSLIHPFELLEIKKADGNTFNAKWNGKDVVISLLSSEGSMSDKLQQVIRLSMHYPQHPNLLSIYGFSGNLKIDNIIFPMVAISPLLKHGSMMDFLKKPGNQSKAQQLLLPWALQIASALEALHHQGVVHGAIAASSILINDQQQAVLGFDTLSYNSDAVEAVSGRVRRDENGKLKCHLPPESKSINDDKKIYNFTADIFAFGLTLFELATAGNYTFYDWTKDRSDEDILNLFSKTDFQSEINEELPTFVPKELKQLILKCIQSDTSQQPTAYQLVDILAGMNHVKAAHAPRLDKSDARLQQLYEKGLFVKDNNPKFAFFLLRSAAACGHQAAQLKIAEMLALGEQVPGDMSAAIHYYSMAAGNNDQLYNLATNLLVNDQRLTLFALEILDTLANRKYEPARQALSEEGFLQFCTMVAKTHHCNADELSFRICLYALQSEPDFALKMLVSMAELGNKEAMRLVVDLLWKGKFIYEANKHIPENKPEAIRLYALFAKDDSEMQKRLEQMQQEYKADQELDAKLMSSPSLAESTTVSSTAQSKPAHNLRLAFQHFFGLDVLRNLEVAREFLVKAAAGPKADPNAQLARGILSISGNPLDEKCPLRFFVPDDDFKPPFIELDTSVYRVQGRAFRCSIVGRIAVLVALSSPHDSVSLLNQCAHAHPNVIGPIGITAGVKVVSTTGSKDTLPLALLYAPVQGMRADRSMVEDPIKACSRVLPFLVGIAEGLAHLHRSHVIHGNLSLEYMLVGDDRLGLLAVPAPGNLRATAPESLESNHYSSASDVFHFGVLIAYMLTGGSYEDAWISNRGEAVPKTRLARLRASAASGFADIRTRIPQWCPAPLVDIMMRCLRVERNNRPGIDAIAIELQTLRSTLAHASAAAVGPRPAQFWMHTSHICLELTADNTWLDFGGVFECLYGPDFRDRMRQSHNPSTNRCKIFQDNKTPGVMHSKSFGTTTGPSSVLAYPNLAANTRKIIEYKAKFFSQTVLSTWDGSESLPRGIRHFPSWVRGAMLLKDDKLTAFVHHLDKPPQHPKEKHWCTGEADKCQCERAARPKNSGILNRMTTEVLRLMMSFLDMADYGALAGVNKFTAHVSEENMPYWINLIKGYGNQRQIHLPLKCLENKPKQPEAKQSTHEGKKSTAEQKVVAIKQQIQKPIVTKSSKRQKVKFNAATKNQYFYPMIRRWAKIIATQELYKRAYTDLQLATTDVLHIPDITREERKAGIETLENKFKDRKHACGCCHKPVAFDKHLKENRTNPTKYVGGVFMACSDCLSHHVWTREQASLLWGFTHQQLEKIPCWRYGTGTVKLFLTADLLDFRRIKPMKKRIANPKNKAEPDVTKRFLNIKADLYNRYPDLPEEIRNEYSGVEPPHPADVKRVPPPKLNRTDGADESSAILLSPLSIDTRDEDKMLHPQVDAPSLQDASFNLPVANKTRARAGKKRARSTEQDTKLENKKKAKITDQKTELSQSIDEKSEATNTSRVTAGRFLLFYKKEPFSVPKAEPAPLAMPAEPIEGSDSDRFEL